MTDAPHSNLFCHRCGEHLSPGVGDCYVVRVEAFADPTPPRFSENDLLCDAGEEIDRLIEQMSEMSQQELMDQVCRRFTLHLCGPCYRQWIENPTP